MIQNPTQKVKRVTICFPQRSILGPISFNNFINDPEKGKNAVSAITQSIPIWRGDCYAVGLRDFDRLEKGLMMFKGKHKVLCLRYSNSVQQCRPGTEMARKQPCKK